MLINYDAKIVSVKVIYNHPLGLVWINVTFDKVAFPRIFHCDATSKILHKFELSVSWT
jgi:hypothetical protein